MNIFEHIGRYCILISKCFVIPEKYGVFRKQVVHEMNNLGIRSITIVVIISIFMGAVITIQTALNLENPLIPKYYIGLGTRDSMLLEFSSTVVGLILAGKVGSNIASELGSMRISEQIDALDIMGVNSAGYLILPKIISAVLFHPVLNAISILVGVFGGWLAAVSTQIVSPAEFLYGVHFWFEPFYVTYSFIKTIVFAFIITTVSAYHGYYVRGGSLEVGRASTKAVVNSSVLILLFNLILTQIMLT